MSLTRSTCKEERPCGAWLRNGISCKWFKCPYSHIPIDKLSPYLQKVWIAHVHKTGSHDFNTKRVKSAACSMKNMRPAAALDALPVAA